MPATISTTPFQPEMPQIVKEYAAYIAAHRSPLVQSAFIGYNTDTKQWEVLCDVRIGSVAFHRGFRIDDGDDIEQEMGTLRGHLDASIFRFSEEIRAVTTASLLPITPSNDRDANAAMVQRALDALCLPDGTPLIGVVSVGTPIAFNDANAVQLLIFLNGRRFHYSASGSLVWQRNEAPSAATIAELITALISGLRINLQIGEPNARND